MNPPIISQENKDLNFQAIAPVKNEPVMVRTKVSKKKSFAGVFFLLFLAAAAGAGWYYKQNQDLEKQLLGLKAEINAQKEKSDITGLSPIERLNRHMLLPQAHNAELKTISEAGSLKQNDTFYEYAENGDLLVQFPNLEVIYNANADVIVNARTRNTGQVAGAEARALQGAITLDIRNGSGVAGIAGKTAETFKGVKDYVLKNVGNAVKSSYPQTVIVNLSGKNVSGLEKQFKVTAVTVLPQGEKSSDADVIIILGKS